MNRYAVGRFAGRQQMQEFVAECDRRFDRDTERAISDVLSGGKLSFFGLTGPTCAGKTTAAKKLKARMEADGHRVLTVALDDFFLDKESEKSDAVATRGQPIDFDSEAIMDVAELTRVVSLLSAGKPCRMPRFEFIKARREAGEWLIPQAGDIVLFEGIQVLYPKIHAILNREGFKVLFICPESGIEVGDEVFLPNQIRFLRRLVRDFRYRGAAPEFTDFLWRGVRENEEKSIFPNVGRADVRIDSTLPYEIGMLKPYLEEMLARVPENDVFYPGTLEILKKLKGVQTIPTDLLGADSLYREFI